MPVITKKSTKEEELLDILLKNSVALQKAALDIVKSNNDLVKRIDNLIFLFEEASKHITASGSEEDIKGLTARLDSLIEQNKDLAKGLILLEDYVRTKSSAINPITL